MNTEKAIEIDETRRNLRLAQWAMQLVQSIIRWQQTVVATSNKPLTDSSFGAVILTASF